MNRFQIVEEAIQQHALQHGAVAFLEDIADSQKHAAVPDTTEAAARAATLEDELPELHGPCDRFAAPPAPTSHLDYEGHMSDVPDPQPGASGRDEKYWSRDEEEGQGEVPGPPSEEDPEPASLDSEPCGEAPPAGEFVYLNSEVNFLARLVRMITLFLLQVWA